MKKQQTGRSYKLIRNILLIILALIVWWLILGTPALTKNQAFRRAMREHFLDPKDAEVFFGEDGRISALAKADDPIFNVYVQTGVRRSGLFWYHLKAIFLSYPQAPSTISTICGKHCG